jgi:endonuclease-8
VPEGDTIFRTATTLRRWLVEREITAARTTAPVPVQLLVGDRVTAVDARAKHLLMRFASERVLHTHMRMTGSWHVYPAGQPWHLPAGQARLVLEAAERVAVCFNAPVIELLSAGGERVHPALATLGPDVLVDPLDVGAVIERAARRPPETQIGDLLLDQQVVSGIGNIYRCEALFLTGVHPSRLASGVDLGAVVTAAARIMRANLGPGGPMGRNVGLGADDRWVYRRSGRPCRRCGTRVESGRVGMQARTAYWCPRCQPSG